MKYSEIIKYRNARRKVEVLKGFYKHLFVYCIVNIALFILRGEVLQFVQNESTNKSVIDWIDWNILIVPVFWGIGLVFHTAKVFQFKFNFIADWEKRQLKKFIKEQ